MTAKNTNFLQFLILVLAIVATYMQFMWEFNIGPTLADEGFLWYGAQRTMLGEVPIRDFMAYDPGRYYWSAAIMSLLGDNSIVALRGAAAVFQGIGIFVGLLLISNAEKKQNFIYVLFSAIAFVLWMYAPHIVFDTTASILLVGILAYLIQNPTSRRYYVVGLCIGLIAVFGRNHGVYGVVGSLGVMMWLNINRAQGVSLLRGLGLWAAGIVTGYMPILLMALVVPGFFDAFLESILFLFESKTTNIPLPIPWHWIVNFHSGNLPFAVKEFLVGIFFIGVVCFGVLSILWVSWQRFHRREVTSSLVAASFMALPYAHYVFSRADIEHLARGGIPFLIGCLVLFSTQRIWVKWLSAIILVMASVITFLEFHVTDLICSEYENPCVATEFSGNEMRVQAEVASDVNLLRAVAKQYAPHGEAFIAAPFYPGAYALLERKSPMLDIYALLSRSKAFQQAEIERIKVAQPRFALISDRALDGDDKRRFKYTHPLVYQFILENFDPLPGTYRPDIKVYIAKIK